jgi:hypothetical protein
MAQIFHASFNTLSRVSIFGGVFFVGLAAWASAVMLRSPYATRAGVAREQPVPFSHEHHVGGLGIDCRYCHATAEVSAFAGLPPTKTCMSCHSMVFTDAPLLQPVRESYRSDTSIPWVRVHDLPDFVYFDHSIHVAKGVGCTTCHGAVDRMPLTSAESSLAMEWCLGCHRDPEPFLRPRAAVVDPAWDPQSLTAGQRAELASELGVKRLTDCTTCHR